MASTMFGESSRLPQLQMWGSSHVPYGYKYDGLPGNLHSTRPLAPVKPLASMRLLSLTSLLLSVLALHAAPSVRKEFEKEASARVDLEQFAKDMSLLDSEVEAEAKEHAAETEELLKNIGPLSDAEAEAERAEEAVNAEIADEVYEGDLVLTNEQLDALLGPLESNGRRRRQADTPSKYPANIWGTAPIPFSFAPSASEEIKRLVRLATRFWSDNTCINFQENGAGNNKIVVASLGGCYSSVGMVGGSQTLSLQNDGCNSFSTATHELEHALGVYHEQSRADRDYYVNINLNNIPEKNEHNFKALSAATSQSFGVPYEFGSNMHYTQDSFAEDYRIPTIVAKGPYANYQNSMRGHQPSFLDVLLVNRFYKCLDKCNSRANPCLNGGYLDPRACSRCVCPEGLGGQRCTEDPAGSKLLTSSTQYQSISIKLGAYGVQRDTYETATYVINAPQGRRVELTIDGVWGAMSSGCGTNGIEVKPARDLQPRGFRYCGGEPKPKVVVSETNRLPIMVWSNRGEIRADVRYRYY